MLENSNNESLNNYLISAKAAKELGIEPGEHLRVPMSKYGDIFYHHGIYIGDGAVIHFYKKENSIKPTIEQTSLITFAHELSKIEKVLYPTLNINSQKVIARAKQLLKLPNNARMRIYDLLSNNCEHIATYCKTGVSTSSQAQPIIDATRAVKVTVKDAVETAIPKISEGVVISERMIRIAPVARSILSSGGLLGWVIPASIVILKAIRILR